MKVSLGEGIKKIRQQKGLSQEKLARLTDISLNTLTKIESGFTKSPSFQTVMKIANALGVSLDELARELTHDRRRDTP
jgi:transcriptional regulator with XRE-family HTH domain